MGILFAHCKIGLKFLENIQYAIMLDENIAIDSDMDTNSFPVSGHLIPADKMSIAWNSVIA